MRMIASMILLLALTIPSWGQSVVLPAEVKGEVGEFIKIKAITEDKVVSWKAIDPGLNMFPVELLKDTKTAVVSAAKAGKYRILAVTAKGDLPSEFAMTIVIIGTPIPVPPIPPGPDPPSPPTPGDLGPFGGATGLHVLIVYESSVALPLAQHSIIYGQKFRDYIYENAVKGPDGSTPQRRIYDKDIVMVGESKLWQDAMKRPRKSIPWIAAGNGVSWAEGPLPMTIEEAMSFMKKVGK